MSKILAFTKDSFLRKNPHQLQCSICGENDRNKLIVEDIGISIGICGDNYSFCKKCWGSKNLGKKLLHMFGYDELKIIDECLELKEI